jgi:sigma-B regulation protein RsbU (phosphoserine phosphatase)
MIGEKGESKGPRIEMKKIRNFVLGGIESKIFNLVVISMILIIVVFGAVIIYQTKALTTIVEESNQNQRTAIEKISANTMNAVLENSMVRSTQMEAYIADDLFSSLQSEVQMLGDYAGKLFANPSAYPRVDVKKPKKGKNGKTSAQLMYGENVDTKDAFIQDEIGLLGNLSDMMCSLYDNSSINSCIIATPNGITIIADDRPKVK